MHAIEELKAKLSELENKKRDWNEGVKTKDELVNKLNGHKKKLLELKNRYDSEAMSYIESLVELEDVAAESRS